MRIEYDSLGPVEVPEEHFWGAQTQRSLENFKIGIEKQPGEILRAFARLKSACAAANFRCGKLTKKQAETIQEICARLADGEYAEEFPLSVWQTGSGTQTNMNFNEVIARLAAKQGVSLHPNDHVNCSQSSNDTYPSALHIAAVTVLEEDVMSACKVLVLCLRAIETCYPNLIKIGRTHLQDATPILFSQEVSGWRALVEAPLAMLKQSLEPLRRLAIGGTAVGTGLNAPEGFDRLVCEELEELCWTEFFPEENKFHALSSRDALVFAHGALKALAANLMKIANDIRLLGSGPRCGLGELRLPENEPGSSIMPGKVNPTQCEALTMVAVQVMGNDAAIGFAASQGNFQLNVFLPVLAYNFLQSARLLSDAMDSFHRHCLDGLRPVPEKMRENLEKSLMLVTCLTPKIGYEAAAKAARLAHEKSLTLKEAVLQLELLTAEEFDILVDPSKMV